MFVTDGDVVGDMIRPRSSMNVPVDMDVGATDVTLNGIREHRRSFSMSVVAVVVPPRFHHIVESHEAVVIARLHHVVVSDDVVVVACHHIIVTENVVVIADDLQERTGDGRVVDATRARHSDAVEGVGKKRIKSEGVDMWNGVKRGTSPAASCHTARSEYSSSQTSQFVSHNEMSHSRLRLLYFFIRDHAHDFLQHPADQNHPSV